MQAVPVAEAVQAEAVVNVDGREAEEYVCSLIKYINNDETIWNNNSGADTLWQRCFFAGNVGGLSLRTNRFARDSPLYEYGRRIRRIGR